MSSDSRKLTTVSLFSGAGGLDVGFERAGFECIWANEFDRDAAEAWRLNRPDGAEAMHEGDIVLLLDTLSELRGRVDCIIGGPPCQSWPVAGKMDPDDPRGAMVFRFIDAVRIVQPRAFLMENVKNLADSRRFEQARADIAEGFDAAGYDMRYHYRHGLRCTSAQETGLFHRDKERRISIARHDRGRGARRDRRCDGRREERADTAAGSAQIVREVRER